MQVRTPRIKTSFSIAILWCIALFTSCSEDMPIDHPNGDLSGERISFGVSKGASSWKPDSRALSINESRALPCESEDLTFGVSVETKWRDTPNDSPQSRGAQFTTDSTLSKFDVTAFYYEENATTAETFFTETVTDGVNTTGKTYYWPREGSMDFIAIAPIGIVNPMPTVDDYNTHSKAEFTYTIPDNISEQRDIMVAVSKGLTKETGNPVPLNFKHLLASVRFKVAQTQPIRIDSLILSGVLGGDVTFTYDKNSTTWENSVPITKKTYRPRLVDSSFLPAGSEIAGNVNNATLFMIPQELPDGSQINVFYTELLTGEPVNASVDISGTTWEAGKDYAYAFKIGTSFNVTIPKPSDQDAHYVILKMDYDLGTLSKEIEDVKATATFINDGSNTASEDKRRITLKRELSETQAQGFFTDELWKLSYTVNTNGTTTPSNPKPIRVDSIVGYNSLSITDTKGSIYLFIDENDGYTDRNGELIFSAIVKETNQPIELGRGQFKQLCPYWKDNIGVERIEDADLYPYGFDYNRTVTYSNPTANADLDHWLLGTIRKILLLLFGATADAIIPDSEGIAEDFVEVTTINVWGKDVVKSVTLNYGALNKLDSIATYNDGLINTRNLYNYTGNTDVSELENQLNQNLDNWDKVEPEEFSGGDEYDYAAFVALCRNRMRELYVEIKSQEGTNSFYKVLLHKEGENDSNIGESGVDIIEWYLPSSAEAKNLKETGVGSNVITPLNGTYWSSTAGSDTDAFAHSFTFNNNTFGSINESQPRMDELKVRAVRKKP